jgi:alkanesulfonate monooxygenase SsuD/methylene tetrahydromethanopterin reductase-like flavin-dependent oxidoreductase (luciferase family)
MSSRQIPPSEIRLGVVVPHWSNSLDGATPRWEQIREFTQAAEDAELDSVWLIDDLLIRLDLEDQPAGSLQEEIDMAGGGAPVGFWECWSLLAGLAATTRRIALGTLITNNNFRAPALLAKMADTIDEISAGRLVLGLGAGNNAAEHQAFGLPWAQRYGRFEQAIPIIHDLLRTGRAAARDGAYAASECLLEPRGPSARGPRIMIGGRGPRVMRVAAAFADEWNVWIAFARNTPDAVGPFQEELERACETVGRDPATIERTATVALRLPGGSVDFCGQDMNWAGPIEGSTSEVAERVAAFGEAGISELQVYLGPATLESLEHLAEVRQALRA